jgi:hypothetical protein
MKKVNFFVTSLVMLLFFVGCDSKPECFTEVTAFDKVTNQTIFKDKYRQFIKTGALVESKIEYGKYMNSLIKGNIKLYQVDKIVTSHLTGSSSEYKVKYTIIENDKLDPGKKSQKCKIFAGYLLFEFFYQDKSFYKVQMDFMSTKGEDLSKRIDCIFKNLEYKHNKL